MAVPSWQQSIWSCRLSWQHIQCRSILDPWLALLGKQPVLFRLALLVLGIGLDAADVMRFHLVQSVHQLLQLLLEAAAHTTELVALSNLASGTLQRIVNIVTDSELERLIGNQHVTM